eukprot:TRINITY_DN2187_c0_g1_i1.p2 TRINITY_DN2187_c0_g1~~TRINITY_DN2187_c0_g1_i1.p2  ORF type:complete len:347 (+),score=137.30 TRINITY_DN2187_c0_g1_i1:304-1344(+)
MTERDVLVNRHTFDSTDEIEGKVTSSLADLGGVTADLDPEQYLKIQDELLTSRNKIRYKMAESGNIHEQAQASILETYSKFIKFVQERDRDPWNDNKPDDDLEDEPSIIVSRVLGHTQGKLGEKYRTKLEEQNMELLSELRKVIRSDKQQLEIASTTLEAQRENFNIFLHDQGRVLGLLEKAVARKTTKGNDFTRSSMYKTIVHSLEDSPAMAMLSPAERLSHKNEIYQILRQLELVEAQTDELTERVLLKLKAIQSEEKGQALMIEEQLSAQDGINTDLDDLTEQIDRNNGRIQARTQDLRGDIMAGIEELKKQNVIKCVAGALVFMVVIGGCGIVIIAYFELSK